MMAMYGCGTRDRSARLPRRHAARDRRSRSAPAGIVAGRGSARVLADVTYATLVLDAQLARRPVRRARRRERRRARTSSISSATRAVAIDDALRSRVLPRQLAASCSRAARATRAAISVLTSNPTTHHDDRAGVLARSRRSASTSTSVARSTAATTSRIDSQFVSDDGGKNPTLGDPRRVVHVERLRRLHADDLRRHEVRRASTRVRVRQPFEGDTRAVAVGEARDHARRRAPTIASSASCCARSIATPTGSTYTITTPEIARYCISGGKPGFSYDERWIAFHHYVTAADAVGARLHRAERSGVQPYLQAKGAANLYLMELRTGVPVRITNMQPGQYALFPHFRSRRLDLRAGPRRATPATSTRSRPTPR